MFKPAGIPHYAFTLCLLLASTGSLGIEPPARPGNAVVSSPGPAAVPSARAPGAAPADPAKARFRRPPPLKKLIFSAQDGFALRMVSSQDVTAEIRNGAGRTLARGAYTLEPGDWTLRPRNMAPGLYTVLLRTGPQLRAVKMKIEAKDRGQGAPEWVLEKSPPGFDSLQAPGPLRRMGDGSTVVPGTAVAPGL